MAQLSYDAMRNLILHNRASLQMITIFTPELLTAIFWEETQFENIKQRGGGPAVGFGQIERPTIKDVNSFFKTNFTPERILADDNASVQITSLRLSMLFQRLHTKMAALHGYAGSASNPTNKVIPPRWVDCETQLGAVHAAVPQRPTYGTNADAIKRALRSAKPNSNPDLAFP
jgi:hypothetical protein